MNAFDESIGELQAQLVELRKARATGARRIVYGSGTSMRETEFRSDRELEQAINDLLRRINAASTGRDQRIMFASTSKGYT